MGMEGNFAPATPTSGEGGGGGWTSSVGGGFFSSGGDGGSFTVAAAGDISPFGTPTISDSSIVHPALSLSGSNTIEQSISAGHMKQSEAAPPAHTELREGDKAKITVTNDTSKPADFLIKKDGTVEVSGNPDAGNKPLDSYRIAVEQGADQRVTEKVVDYINERIKSKDINASAVLEADPGLVSEEMNRRFGDRNRKQGEDDSFDELSDKENGGGGGGGCDNGGGGGGGGQDNDQLDDFDQTDKDRDRNRDGEDRGRLDQNRQALSGRDAMRRALQTQDNWENGTANQLGAYSQNFHGWMTGMVDADVLAECTEIDPGPPPRKIINYKKLAQHDKFKAALKGKTDVMRDQGDEAGAKTLEDFSNKLATDDNFAKGFSNFMSGQEGKQNASADDMKAYFGKDMQEAVLSSDMSKMAHDMGVQLKDMNETQAGDLALSMLVGHKVTADEKAQLMQQKMYSDYVTQIQQIYKAGKGG